MRPIPTRGGDIDPTPYPGLDEVAAGLRITVRSVSDQDPERLRYFESVGLVPGAEAEVRESAVDGGCVILTVGRGREPLTLPADVARRVTVIEG